MKTTDSAHLNWGVLPQRGRNRSASALSAQPSSRPPKANARPLTDSNDDASRNTNNDGGRHPLPFSQTSESRSPNAAQPPAVPSDVGMGGRPCEIGRARGTAREPPAYVFAGKVRNLGRGVWGFGSILGWIPADVRPWDYCRRKGWVQIFSRFTAPLTKSRPYVLGDDRKFHLPQSWEEV